MEQPRLALESTANFQAIVVDPLNLQTIADYAGGILRRGNASQLACDISTDSRAVGCDALFLALRGDKFDGHRFVADVARGQAVGAIVESGFVAEGIADRFALIDVDDTLLAYQKIAGKYRQSLPLKLIAVTGSNGKTSTKDITAALLASRYRVLKTAGNFNNHIGVPKTLLDAETADEIAVLEIGMNHPGEIAPLAALAAPELAIITNVGTAHIEYMKTRAAIAQEKGALAEAVGPKGHVVFPAEEEFASYLAGRTSATKVTVGFRRGDLRAENLRPTLAGTHFTLVVGTDRFDAYLPVPGRHMVVNSLLALAAARIYEVGWEQCLASLSTASLTKGRLEWKVVDGFHVLDDTYNANPDSVVAALETLARLPTAGRRIAVLGKMGELGEETESGHRRVGEAAAHEKLDQVIAVGSNGEHIARGVAGSSATKIEWVPSVQDAASWLREFARPEDLILIKGSRSAGMERILALLTSRETSLSS